MTDETSLLAAIWRHPNEDTPRLMYADWLQEHGQPERGEFIRAQCAMATLAEDDPQFRKVRATSNRLSKKHGAKWKESIPKEHRSGDWYRGFWQPHDRGIYLDGLLRMPTRDLLIAPTRSFWVMDIAERYDELLVWPFLDRLNTFYFSGSDLSGDWLAKALACKGLCNIRRVSFNDCSVIEVEALLTAWQDHRLTEIRLSGSKIGDEGFRMLMNHPVLPSVREITIYNLGLTAAGVRALAASSYHPPVPELRLGNNPIGDAGIAELIRWPGLSRIKKLGLYSAEITDTGATLLAGCEALRSVETLWLIANQIGESGAMALANSPNLDGLTELHVKENPIPDSAITALRAHFGDKLKSPR